MNSSENSDGATVMRSTTTRTRREIEFDFMTHLQMRVAQLFCSSLTPNPRPPAPKSIRSSEYSARLYDFHRSFGPPILKLRSC
jgi:hypothetical protein